MSSTTTAVKRYIHWIHCNRCYEVFIKKERKFFLLACYHILCESCQAEIKQDHNGAPVYKCSVCQNITRGCEICSTMPSKLKVLFHPEPYLAGMNYFLILKFQTVHRRQYLEYIEKRENTLKVEYETAVKCKELCKKLYLSVKLQTVRIVQIQKKVLSIKQQRRDFNDNRPYKTVSMLSSNSSATPAKRPRFNRSRSPNESDEAITTFSDITSIKSHSFFF